MAKYTVSIAPKVVVIGAPVPLADAILPVAVLSLKIRANSFCVELSVACISGFSESVSGITGSSTGSCSFFSFVSFCSFFSGSIGFTIGLFAFLSASCLLFILFDTDLLFLYPFITNHLNNSFVDLLLIIFSIFILYIT